MLSNAKIVGMGEATHGTKEFSQMRYRLFKHMVTRHGYKAIAFENSWGASWYMNQYVLNESTELQEPLGGFSWPWTTKEVLAMVKCESRVRKRFSKS
jgi:erythromycin esterase